MKTWLLEVNFHNNRWGKASYNFAVNIPYAICGLQTILIFNPISLEWVQFWHPCHFPFFSGTVFALNLSDYRGIGLSLNLQIALNKLFHSNILLIWLTWTVGLLLQLQAPCPLTPEIIFFPILIKTWNMVKRIYLWDFNINILFIFLIN